MENGKAKIENGKGPFEQGQEQKGVKKEIVETGKQTEYTLDSMNAQLANSYYWYRFTWHPSGWRGASL